MKTKSNLVRVQGVWSGARGKAVHLGGLALMAATSVAAAQGPWQELFPTLPHAANNNFPFNMSPGTTMHQVYASTLFSNLSGGAPVVIDRIAFAATSGTLFQGDVVLRLGYTNAIPGQTPAAGGLLVPNMAGGGTPNAVGTMHDFFSAPVVFAVTNPGSANFQFAFTGTPFEYDPSQGNLLLEIYITNFVQGITISRCAGSAEASRAYHQHTGTTGALSTQAHRTEFNFSLGTSGCYANCDGSTVEPILNVDDFTCFINEYAQGQALPHEQQVGHYANCDGSTIAPALNVDDFTCFINEYAVGCT